MIQHRHDSRRVSHVIQRGVVALAFSSSFISSATALAEGMEDLGTFGGSYSIAFDINSSGQVTGYAETAEGEEHVFLYSDGVMQDLGTLGGTHAEGLGINDAGEVVGFSGRADGTDHAFLYSGGVMQDLGTLGGDHSYAMAINDAGEVVGYSATVGDGEYHAFLYSDGVMHDISPPGGPRALAQDINAAGEVTGEIQSSTGTWHAAFYSGGSWQDLGTLGGNYSEGRAINSTGQVTGYAYSTGNFVEKAILYGDGVMTGIGDLGGGYSYGNDINTAGQVVGESNLEADGEPHAFLYSAGVMQDLGTFGGEYSSALAINDAGLIVGVARDAAGEEHAFLYTPPSSGTVTFTRIDFSVRNNSSPDADGLRYAYAAGASRNTLLSEIDAMPEYCGMSLSSTGTYGPQVNCPAGGVSYHGTYLKIRFYSTTADVGALGFRSGTDWGAGGAIFIDGIQIASSLGDSQYASGMWWNGNWSNPAVLSATGLSLTPGAHTIELFGFEPCCSGNASLEYTTSGVDWSPVVVTAIPDADMDGVPDAADVCPGGDDTFDTDSDGTPDDCESLDGDADGVVDADDNCPADANAGQEDGDGDGTGDACDPCTDMDGDEVCDELDGCPVDPDKAEPGVCGCGTPDADADSDGVVDCLEEAMALEGLSAHLYFDYPPYASLQGKLELSGGLLAPDLRDGGAALGTVALSIAETPVYHKDVTFTVYDTVTSTSADNSEKWEYKASWKDYTTLRWKDSQEYNSSRDATMPAYGTGAPNYGKVYTRFIRTDSSRIRLVWDATTVLPLTITIDGVVLASISRSGSGYSVDTGFELFDVYTDGNNTRMVDIEFPDRLGDGNVMRWYNATAETFGDASLLHSHEVIDDGTATATFYNAGGEFQLNLPLTGYESLVNAEDKRTILQLQLGTTDSSAIVDGACTFVNFSVLNNHWYSNELEQGD